MFILTNFVALHEWQCLNLAISSKKGYNLDGNGSVLRYAAEEKDYLVDGSWFGCNSFVRILLQYPSNEKTPFRRRKTFGMCIFPGFSYETIVNWQACMASNAV